MKKGCGTMTTEIKEKIEKKRFLELEKNMEWAHERIQKMERTLENIQVVQNRTLEKLMEYRIHTDERISALQAHTEDRFISVHARLFDLQKEIGVIHSAIAVQTKWLLTTVLAAATLVSVLHPLVETLLHR